LRTWLRRLALGAATLAGRRKGFFIPYRYAASARLPDGGYPALAPLFDARRSAFTRVLADVDSLGDALRGIGAAPPPAPRWDQGWFAPLDAAVAYTLVRTRKPQRIVEVGSGHSTRFFARAVRDGGFATQITAIDPAPRASLDGLPMTIIRATVQIAGLAPFAALAAGDFLSIDSSHVLMPGTDVDLLINRIWPMLPPGVVVHVHDIFLPDDYPRAWTWRGYNEQLAVAPLLHGNEIVFASRYVSTRMADDYRRSIVATLPAVPNALPASLWLVKS
jgi:hypothetical protein